MGMQVSAHTFSVTTALPVIAFYLHSLQMPRDWTENKADKKGFQVCVRFFELLGDIHWHAGFYHHFFQMLLNRDIVESSNKRPSSDPQASASRRRRHSHGSKTDTAAEQKTEVLQNPSEAAASWENPDTMAAQQQLDSPLTRSDPGPSTGPLPAQDLSASVTPQDPSLPPPSFDFALDDLMNFDDGMFDGWLEDYSKMQTLLPSA